MRHSDAMLRLTIYVTKEQSAFLRTIDERPVSQHIRSAIDSYVAFHTNRNNAAAKSPSKFMQFIKKESENDHVR